MLNNKFVRGAYDKNEIRILSASFKSKKLTRAGY